MPASVRSCKVWSEEAEKPGPPETDFGCYGIALANALAGLEELAKNKDSLCMNSLSTSRSRILIVEDTPVNILALSAALRKGGYQISEATNGRQALDMVARIQPDLILLDVMMPEMDGFETCRRLKAGEQSRQIPVIFITGKTDSADIVKAFE